MNPNGIFATNNTDPGGINVVGATLQGQIRCVYADLINTFGAPIDNSDSYSWLVRFNDFTVAEVIGPKNILTAYYWDIKGFDKTAFIRVSTAVQRSLKEAA